MRSIGYSGDLLWADARRTHSTSPSGRRESERVGAVDSPDGFAEGLAAATVAGFDPLDDFEELALRAERLEAVDGARSREWRGLIGRLRTGP